MSLVHQIKNIYVQALVQHQPADFQPHEGRSIGVGSIVLFIVTGSRIRTTTSVFLQVLLPTPTQPLLAAKGLAMAKTSVGRATCSCWCSTVGRCSVFGILFSKFVTFATIHTSHLFRHDSACTFPCFYFRFAN